MKSGDRVRVKAGNKHEGQTGTVTTDSQGAKTVEVELHDESTAWHTFAAEELEAIE